MFLCISRVVPLVWISSADLCRVHSAEWSRIAYLHVCKRTRSWPECLHSLPHGLILQKVTSTWQFQDSSLNLGLQHERASPQMKALSRLYVSGLQARGNSPYPRRYLTMSGETFLIDIVRGLLLASSGQRPEILQNILPYDAQDNPLQQRIIQSKMSTVLRLRNPDRLGSHLLMSHQPKKLTWPRSFQGVKNYTPSLDEQRRICAHFCNLLLQQQLFKKKKKKWR